LYDAEKKHSENMKNAIALPSMEAQAVEYKRPLDIDTWEYRNRNYVMYVPDGKFCGRLKLINARNYSFLKQ
jgi:protein DGCR14